MCYTGWFKQDIYVIIKLDSFVENWYNIFIADVVWLKVIATEYWILRIHNVTIFWIELKILYIRAPNETSHVSIRIGICSIVILEISPSQNQPIELNKGPIKRSCDQPRNHNIQINWNTGYTLKITIITFTKP